MAKETTSTKSIRVPDSVLDALRRYVAQPGIVDSENAVIVQFVIEGLKRKQFWPPTKKKAGD